MRTATLLLLILLVSRTVNAAASSLDDLEPTSPNDIPLVGVGPDNRSENVQPLVPEVDVVNYMPPLTNKSSDSKTENSPVSNGSTMPTAEKSSTPTFIVIAFVAAGASVLCYRKLTGAKSS